MQGLGSLIKSRADALVNSSSSQDIASTVAAVAATVPTVAPPIVAPQPSATPTKAVDHRPATVSRNANCEADAPATCVCHFVAEHREDPLLRMEGSVLSCKPQMSGLDSSTSLLMQQKAAASFSGAGASFNASDFDIKEHVCYGGGGAGETQLSIDELLKYKMASNCAPRFDISNVTQYNRYSCQYYGERIDEHGNRGHNVGDRMTGILASCDGGGHDPRTEADIRAIVAHQMGDSAPNVDLSKIRCDIMSLPPSM